MDVIRKECSDSSIVKLHDMEVPVVEDTCKDKDLPPTPSEAAQTLLKSETAVTADDLCKKMDLTELQLTILTSGTIEQSQCTAWKEHRKRRCMSSISKRIYTRTKTVLNNPNTDVTALVIEVMGYECLVRTKAMKHGIALEPKAKKEFEKIMNRQHKKYSQCDTGIHILKTHQHIGASPDLLIECDCHDLGICEEKCPLHFEDQLTPENSSHLVRLDDHNITLSNSSPYYFQLQHNIHLRTQDILPGNDFI